MEEDLHVLNREIPDAALIAAMDPMSGSATYRTGRARRHPFTGEDQTRGLSTVGKKAEVVKMGKKGYLETREHSVREVVPRGVYSFILPQQATFTKPAN
jgi:hypothetical protein